MAQNNSPAQSISTRPYVNTLSQTLTQRSPRKKIRKNLLRNRSLQIKSVSRQNLREPSPLDVRRGVEVAEKFDGFAGLRNVLRGIAEKEEEWAGMPMPLEHETLVVEPDYPRAEKLMAFGQSKESATEPEDTVVRNVFWSWHLRSDVVVIEKEGRITHGILPGNHHLDQLLRTLGCSEAWGIEQEGAAVRLIGRLLPHHALKKYLLTGSFLEKSKRSGVTYLFRRLKPTVAIVEEPDNSTRILCALCMHPIAYYQGSWAGAMCPTDDVIAHLMLMRGDEKMFWRRSSQHQSWRPQAGI